MVASCSLNENQIPCSQSIGMGNHWIIAKEVRIRAGEFKKFYFNVKLPSTWAPKKGKNLQYWHLSLRFVVKIGSKSLPLAKCVLPVYKSSRPPSYTPPVFELSNTTPIKTEPVPDQHDDNGNEKSENEKIEMKFCDYCGEEIRKQAFYCEFCGTKQ